MSKLDTGPRSPRTKTYSDLERIDAHVVQPEEYDEIPELTDEMMARAVPGNGEDLIRRGRPPSTSPKRQVTVRLDPDVLARLRATGPGWQTRIDDVLRAWLNRAA